MINNGFSLRSPKYAIEKYDAVEVAPCVVLDDGSDVVRTGETEKAHFWSVYLYRKNEGDDDCIANFPTPKMAHDFCAVMLALIQHVRLPIEEVLEVPLTEFRITWAFVPMTHNPTRVSYIRAASPDLAKIELRQQIERTEGRILGFYTCNPA